MSPPPRRSGNARGSALPESPLPAPAQSSVVPARSSSSRSCANWHVSFCPCCPGEPPQARYLTSDAYSLRNARQDVLSPWRTSLFLTLPQPPLPASSGWQFWSRLSSCWNQYRWKQHSARGPCPPKYRRRPAPERRPRPTNPSRFSRAAVVPTATPQIWPDNPPIRTSAKKTKPNETGIVIILP